MSKCWHMLLKHCFVWVIDCYAAWFLLSCNCSNQAVQCLQMCIMGWDVYIVHQANNYLTVTDYWSRLDSNLCYDPTFKDYILLVSFLQSQLTSPSDLPILPRNMPYYRGPWIKATPPTLDAEDEGHQILLATQSIILIQTYLPMYQTAQFNLEFLTNLFLPVPVTACGITTSSQHMHFSFHN